MTLVPHPGSDTTGVHAPWTGRPADYKLIVDYFAGGGGASKGIEMAMGRSPDIAVNHDAEAIALHRANHPDTLHLQNDIWTVMPEMVRLIGNRTVELFHASPDCKHFSKAKGGKPVKRKIRDLAWIVPQFATRFRPEVITLENVEEFAGWGPLVQKIGFDGRPMFDEQGRPHMVPCKKRKGETFRQWVAALERLGYKVAWKELRASDYGAPTIRKRLFIVARRDGGSMEFPEITHGDPERPKFKARKLRKWRTAAECIDWSLPCPSIFDTSEQIKAKYGVRAKRPLAPKTEARIAKGIWRFVKNNPRPYVVNLTHVGGDRIESLDVPFRTITGAHRGEKALAMPFLAPRYQAKAGGQPRTRSVDVPAATIVAGGNVPGHLVLPHITKFNTGSVGSEVDMPLFAVTANSFIKRPGGAAPLGMVAAHVLKQNHGDNPASDAGKPLHTIVAGGQTQAVVETHLEKPQITGAFIAGVGGRMGQTESRSVDNPAQTLTAKADAVVVTPFIARVAHGDVDKTGKKRGQGAHPLDQPLPTQTTSPDYTVVAPVISRAQHGGGNRPADEPMHTLAASRKDQNQIVVPHLMTMRNADKPHNEADKPAHTIMADGARLNVVAAFLAKHFGGHETPGADMAKPVSTVTVKDHHALVSAGLVSLHGTSDAHMTPRDVEDPAPAICAEGTHLAATTAFMTKFHGDGGQHSKVSDPLHTIDTKDRMALCTVMIAGEPWLIVDIGMRMLTPPELFRAQGFKPDYIINYGCFLENGNEVWKKLTATASVRLVGNSVSPDVEFALLSSLFPGRSTARMAA